MTESSETPFFRTGKIFWLLLAGLLVYAVTLVVTVPVGWLWRQASPHLNLPPQVAVHQVSGRLWRGAAGISFDARPLTVSWRFRAPSLANLSWPLEVSLASAQSRVQGRLDASWPAGLHLTARGQLRIREFEDLIRQSGGAMLEGDVAIQKLELEWRDGRFTRIDGLALWPGGEVSWPIGNNLQYASFPAMQAALDSGTDRVTLEISQQGQGVNVAEADILSDGMLEVRVFKRLIDLAGQPWSGAAAPGDVVFRVRQPLLPGGSF